MAKALTYAGLKKKKRSRFSMETKRNCRGYFFVLPWIIGLGAFFVYPLVLSFIISMSKLKILPKGQGFELTWVGIKNFVDAFTDDAYFLERLIEAGREMIIDLPFILLFSLFIAVLLNKPFKGRGFLRSVFFLPVVATSGVMVFALTKTTGSAVVPGGSAGGTTEAMIMLNNLNVKVLLQEIITDPEILSTLIMIMDRAFTIMWSSGVQILIFLAGLQSISGSIYESARVDGATEWEMFWRITVPMIMPIFQVNVVYTIADSFTDYTNTMLQYVDQKMFSDINYGLGSAMAWIYFLSNFIILMLAIGLVRKMTNSYFKD